MKMNRTLAYGLVCLHRLEAEGRNRPWVQLADIARDQGLPRAYCHKVLQALVHSGLVRSVRGKGYRLARPLDKISVWAVMEAFTFNGAPKQDKPELSILLYESLREQVNKWLVGLTLDDVVQLSRPETAKAGPEGA